MNSKSNNLTFLRLLLATMVMFQHSILLTGEPFKLPIDLGDLAVDAFFVISGFLITESWFRNPDPVTFLRKRILRIYPAFLFSTFLIGLVAAPLLFGTGIYFKILDVGRFATYTLCLQYHGPLARFGTGYSQFNVPVWTIHMEMWCYLLLLVIGAIGLLQFRGAVLGLFLLVDLGYALQPVRDFVGSTYFNPYLLPLPVAMFRFLGFFLAGSVFFLYRDHISLRKPWAVVALGLALLAAYYGHALQPVLPMALAYAVFTFAFAPIPWLDWFKRRGDISYGTYLYAWPVQFVLVFLWPGINFYAHFLLAAIGAYGCGFISWHLLEKRVLSHANPVPVRTRIHRRVRALPGLLAARASMAKLTATIHI